MGMETRACDTCGKPVTRRSQDFRTDRAFCDFACKGMSQRKETGRRSRRLVKAPTHPLASKRGYVLKARFLLYEQIGPGTHPCHWCQRPVTWAIHTRIADGVLVADHVDGDCYNDVLENLVAACQPCNATRARLIPDGELTVTRRDGKRRRAVTFVCDWCGATFAGVEQSTPREHRYCSQPCYWASKKGNRIAHLNP